MKNTIIIIVAEKTDMFWKNMIPVGKIMCRQPEPNDKNYLNASSGKILLFI